MTIPFQLSNCIYISNNRPTNLIPCASWQTAHSSNHMRLNMPSWNFLKKGKLQDWGIFMDPRPINQIHGYFFNMIYLTYIFQKVDVCNIAICWDSVFSPSIHFTKLWLFAQIFSWGHQNMEWFFRFQKITRKRTSSIITIAASFLVFSSTPHAFICLINFTIC